MNLCCTTLAVFGKVIMALGQTVVAHGLLPPVAAGEPPVDALPPVAKLPPVLIGVGVGVGDGDGVGVGHPVRVAAAAIVNK